MIFYHTLKFVCGFQTSVSSNVRIDNFLVWKFFFFLSSGMGYFDEILLLALALAVGKLMKVLR